MKTDGNKYADDILEAALPYEVFSTSALMVNENSGHDIVYQYNKVHNLKLAGKTINHLLIEPGQTFSFWIRVRHADEKEPYKEGLVLVNDKIIGEYGGGLCQLSNLLFWMFLHTPLSIVERHGHAIESFPTTTHDLPYGTDATINEGWLDLKVKNNTEHFFQIEITFDEKNIYGSILSDARPGYQYEIYNRDVHYYRKNNAIYQASSVDCRKTHFVTGETLDHHLYDSVCEIGYELPENINIEEGE